MRLEKAGYIHRASEAVAESEFDSRNSGKPLKGLNKRVILPDLSFFKNLMAL